MTLDIFKGTLGYGIIGNMKFQVMQAPFLLAQSKKLHNDSM